MDIETFCEKCLMKIVIEQRNLELFESIHDKIRNRSLIINVLDFLPDIQFEYQSCWLYCIFEILINGNQDIAIDLSYSDNVLLKCCIENDEEEYIKYLEENGVKE